MRYPIAILDAAQRQRHQQQPAPQRSYLAPSLFNRIGSAMHAECLIKTQLLGWSASTPLVCLTKGPIAGNAHLVLRYFGRFIQFLPEDEAPLEWLTECARLDACFELAVVQKEQVRFTPAATIAARHAWTQRQRAPLLTLNEEDRAYGLDFLHDQGLDPSKPLVVLHCRHEFDEKTNFRNSAVERIGPTIDWLREQDFNVVRLGDTQMPALPPRSGVIDLATQFPFDARLNVFFLAAARFYVGSASGPLTVPPCFGVSTVSIDTLPIGAACGTEQDTYLPNRVVRADNGEEVPWSEAFSVEASIAHFDHQWAALGMRPLPNTEEDILEAVQYHARRHGLIGAADHGPLPMPNERERATFAALTHYGPSALSEPIRARMSAPFMARHARLLGASL